MKQWTVTPNLGLLRSRPHCLRLLQVTNSAGQTTTSAFRLRVRIHSPVHSAFAVEGSYLKPLGSIPVTAQPFDLWTFPIDAYTSLGAWLLIVPITESITIPQAFQPGCAPVVSRRLRSSVPNRTFQNSLIRLATFIHVTWMEVTPEVPLTMGTGLLPRLHPFIS